MGMRLIRGAAATLSILLASGCTAAGDCAGVGRPSVSVTVLNQTNESPTALGAKLYLFRNGSSALLETVTGTRDDLPIEAGQDAGTFDLVVEKSGFFPWTATGVHVTEKCSINTVPLTARLRPRGSA